VKAQDVENFKRKLLEMRRDLLGQVERKKIYSKEIGEDGIPDSGDVAAYSYSKEVLWVWERMNVRNSDSWKRR
jgi:DnaK suppressor protein